MLIALLGYMGSGKSVVGKALAKSLNHPFLDLDSYMEEEMNSTIPEIFEQRGELFFRKKEHEFLRKVLDSNENMVLSTGGGTPCYSGNMELLLQATSNVFYLQLSVDGLTKRLSGEMGHRPLISHLPKEELADYIGKHIFERQVFYNRATHTIKCDGKTVAEIVKMISAQLV
ncbi:shikimate kinase [Muriicola soli]|uniref:Shikimate kinase n=1 Tax=Muriicola soli TaxID=2507538 RepID=A0A411E7J6_9FLAO|nr:shikimate kinase [Muriicola soli]QBA63676.1 shikimate kinase [Muriicola soli]